MRNVGGVIVAIALAGCTAEVPIADGTDLEADFSDDAVQAQDVAALLASQPDAPAVAADVKTDDVDGDGISDVLEEQLLRRYRPYYRFSLGAGGDEQFRPADAIAELEHAQLVQDQPDADGTTSPLSGCGRDGDSHLDPAESLYDCRADASLVASMAKSTYALNLENDRYHGVSLDEARANATGLYGHVAPAKLDGHDAYKIEYWQFFAFNNQDISFLFDHSFGDHEGDWTSVQLWFDRVEHRVARVQYLIHGKPITFDIPASTPSCTDCVVDMHGPAYNPDPGNFLANPAAYSNNAAQFYIDDHKFKHVVVYIEHGSHEFWPGDWGKAGISEGPVHFSLNPHHGDGTAYLVPLTTRVLNMGEVGHPLTRAGDVVLAFNGHWGSTNTRELIEFGPSRRSPVGPAVHCEWQWPERGPIAACEH